jgi:hypothetical protein
MGVRNALARVVVCRRAGVRGLVCLGIGLALAATGCLADPGAGSEALAGVAQAVSGPFSWKGYTWQPTTGGMAGVVPGDAANVTVDSNGYLHLTIAKSGTAWSAAEVFTTENLGFGTYQWQIAGPIDRMDHTVVLGLFPYGPQVGIGADGTNEIDTEFSYWNDELPNVNADWGVYPATAQGTHWEDDYRFSLNGGNETTARMTWTKTSVTWTLLSGIQPLGANNGFIKREAYAPADFSDNIPQQPVPLGMNLWCYNGVPSSGQNVEVVIEDFRFVPEGQPIPGDDAGADSGSSLAEASSGDAGPDPGTGGDAATTSPDTGPSPDAANAGHPPDAGALPGATAGSTAPSFPDAGSGCSCRATGTRSEGEGWSIVIIGGIAFVLLRRRRAIAYGGCPQTSVPSR